MTWVVLSADGDRADEARASAGRFLDAAGRTVVAVHGFRDGFLPYVGGEVKDVFEALKALRRSASSCLRTRGSTCTRITASSAS